MSTPFGPQLIGETEKTLNALLRRSLEAYDLSEPQWVTLRLATALDGANDAAGLAATVSDRAHFVDAAELVAGLQARGLLQDGRLTDAARTLTAAMQTELATTTASIWDALPEDDVAATTRVLNEVLVRARGALR